MRVLVTGASGLVGSHVCGRLAAAGHDVTGTCHRHPERVPAGGVRRESLDLADAVDIERVFAAAAPEVVVHTAALADIGACERDPPRARLLNTEASVRLAVLCRAAGARLLHCSTDQVFDGRKGRYVAGDEPKPIHVYGRTKLAAEREVARVLPRATALRLSLVIGPSPAGDRSASEKVLGPLRRGETITLFDDEIRSPVRAEEVAEVVLGLLAAPGPPILHVGGPRALSRFELGLELAREHGLDERLILRAKQTGNRPPDLSFGPRGGLAGLI